MRWLFINFLLSRITPAFLSLLAFLAESPGHSREITPPDNLTAFPGDGYNSHKEEATPGCLNVIRETGGERQSQVMLHRPATEAEINTYLLSGISDGRCFQSPGLTSWLHSFRETETSTSLRYFVKIKAMTEYLSEVTLSEVGRSLWNQAPERLLATCGDHFISGSESGGYLVVVVSFRFRSPELLKKFIRDTDFSMTGIETFPKKIEYALQVYKEHVGISISARQRGGDITRLPEILGEESLACSRDNLPACMSLGKNLVKYISKPGGYYDQITPERPENLAPLRFLISPYAGHRGLEGLVAVIPEEATFAKESILNHRGSHLRDQRLLAYQLTLTDAQTDIPSLMNLKLILEENLRHVRMAERRCRDSYRDCVAQNILLESRLTAYDRSLLIAAPASLTSDLDPPVFWR